MESLRLSRVEFSAVFLCLLVLVQVDAQSRVEEVVALTSFKNSLDEIDDYNSIAPYWFTWKENDENACAWVGVTCTPNYTVEVLDFSGWGLSTISSFTQLSKLPDLRELDMSSNTLSGSSPLDYGIPDDIGSLTQLSRLDLSDNEFGGSIPSNISACRKLQFLSLENNRITGTIPDLGDLAHLQFLILADNYLSGSFPSELGEMSSLVTIDISANSFNGTITSLLNATNLRIFLLDNNKFVGFEEPIQINAPNLQQLSVSENLLDGVIPLALSDLKDLVTLNMSFNSLSGTIPSGLYHQTGPEFSLDLSSNQLSGSIPPDLLQRPTQFQSLDNLYLNMSFNRLSGTIPPGLYHEVEFEFDLDLSHNHLSGSIPADLLQLTLFVFANIYLSYNFLTGSIPPASVQGNYTVNSTFYPLELDVSHNQLSGPVPGHILSGAYAGLNLEYNFLSGDIVDVLAFAGGLSTLYFGNNYFTGDLSRLAAQWTNWTQVYVLDLSNNNLSWRASESIPDPVSAMLSSMPSDLEEFYIGGNNFSGTSLPFSPVLRANGSLQYLTVFDLSNCQLDGMISGAVFNEMWMSYLLSLNLSHNSATGPVPENITNLPKLQTLDLSYNKLSGALPQIPQNSSLFNTSFYVGNEGLCGYPLAHCPQPSHGTGVQWWVLLTIICGSMMIAIGSCLLGTWRWRVYRKLHEQDADLIKILMERELVTLMSLQNLKKATNNFAESEQIGEGGFGTVYMGKLNDGTKVAIKRSKREGSEKDKEQFLNEVRILSQVNHRHLVKLMGCCMENKVALLVFEFVSNGTLQDHLRGKVGDGHLSWNHRLNIAVQTADALNYLHSATTFPIYHRDVKSANILLNDDLSAKVADFGISKLAPTRATHVSTALQGTIGYMDPEYWVSFQLTEKSDVYSFGVVLLELISAKSPIDFQRGGEETSLAIFANPYIQSENLDPLIDPTLLGTYSEQHGHGKKSILDVGRLAMRCLEIRSHVRPTMNEVWKELQDVHLKFDETSAEEEDLACLGDDDNWEHPLPDLDHQILISPPSWTNRSDSLKQCNDGSLELAYFSHLSPSS